jgi:hypothetical protein
MASRRIWIGDPFDPEFEWRTPSTELAALRHAVRGLDAKTISYLVAAQARRDEPGQDA